MIFLDCVANTSAHGMPHLIKRENNRLSKVIWFVIIVGSLTTFIAHSTTLILSYAKRDTTVSIQLNAAEYVHPDVYICRNSYWSRLNLDYYFKTNDSDFLQLSHYIEDDIDKLFDILIKKDHPNFSNQVIDRLLKNTNFSDFVNYGFYLNDSFVKMSNLFERVPHYRYFSCYKLKENYKSLFFESSVTLPFFIDYHWFRNASFTDNLMNDRSTFMLQQENDLSSESHTVYLTVPGEYPHFNTYYLGLKRGHQSMFYIKMEKHERENRDTQPCLKKYQMVTYLNYLNHSEPISYKANSFDCAIRVHQEEQMNKNNCVHPSFPIPMDLWTKSSKIFCPLNKYPMEDLIQLEYARHNDKQYTKCKGQSVCSVLVYDAIGDSFLIEESRLNKFAKNVYDNWSHLYHDFYYQFSKQKSLEERYDFDKLLQYSFTSISLNIYQYDVRLYEEKFSYGIISLLSDIGGILGFYMGISLITLLEIVAFFGKNIPFRKKKRERSIEENKN